jgi:peptidoglycan/xylan/chitin deacetylase (PgdA/CDA1 family)
MIDWMETTECPYLLAVIPNALSWWMKRRLRTCKYAVVFQHGVTHRNRSHHEYSDEFPSELGRERISSELRRGRQALEKSLGIKINGYVPPWNQISEDALRVLEDMEYKILSANTIRSTSLRQIPVHVDVYSQYRPVTVRSNIEIHHDIEEELHRSELVGVVLHPMSVPRKKMAQFQELITDCEKNIVTTSHWENLLHRPEGSYSP